MKPNLNGFAQELVDSLAGRAGVSFAVVLPDGTRLASGTQAPAFTVVLRNDAALLALMTRGHIGLLESYFDEAIDVEGDIGAAFAAGMASGFDSRFNPLGAVENNLHEWRYSNRSVEQAKANARAHYGLGEAFYRLWLDEPLKMYTCAYWPDDGDATTLEQAQRNKIDHVCRKIRLAAGERFVDIGCGFGGFMFRALETVGALGTGLNTTTEQVDWLRREIARRGLGDRLSVREADFREVDGPYDKVVSIGVLEHAGRDQLAEVIKAHADFLKPGGLGMLHFIGHLGAPRHRTVHPQARVSRRLDPEPGRCAGRDGALRPRGDRHREPAPPLRADARRLGRALRAALAGDPGARSATLHRALSPHLAQLPRRLRRDVPLAGRLHAPVPDRLQQGQRHPRQLPDEPQAPL